jgi:hypothetical protein
MKRQPQSIKPVAAVLAAVMEIDAVELEKLVRQAHECEINQMDEPAEPFIVSRQALRMLWHFRCNLESVEVMPTHG